MLHAIYARQRSGVSTHITPPGHPPTGTLTRHTTAKLAKLHALEPPPMILGTFCWVPWSLLDTTRVVGNLALGMLPQELSGSCRRRRCQSGVPGIPGISDGKRQHASFQGPCLGIALKKPYKLVAVGAQVEVIIPFACVCVHCKLWRVLEGSDRVRLGGRVGLRAQELSGDV